MVLESQRLRSLERRLREVLGEEHARTLMENLPGTDMATRRDIDALERGIDIKLGALRSDIDELEERVDLKLESLENRLLAAFRSELMHQTRTFFIGMVGSMATVGVLAVTAAKLA
jgi:hypothetical protein